MFYVTDWILVAISNLFKNYQKTVLIGLVFVFLNKAIKLIKKEHSDWTFKHFYLNAF